MMKSKQSIKGNKGFTLVEVLVALFALSLCLMLFVGVCSIMKQYPVSSSLSDDVLAIRQLRMVLAQSDDIRLEQGEVKFHYREKDCQLKYHNHRLVKSPGYEIYVKDLEEGSFYEQGGCIYASWKRTKEQHAILYCQ